jgi:UDP-N-acetylglucosamine 2-epimerase (non-hydrolysing)
MENKKFNTYLIVFGTRPEAIKMAPVIKALQAARVSVQICVTAQHRGMLDSVMDFFELKADYDLDLMQPNQSLNKLASRIFDNMDAVLDKAKPDIVLVHGDTTTSSIAAWAAFHRGIKVGHVEAGLRTYNKHAPFPEEVNRQLTARIADYHFAPTETAKHHLINEGISESTILVTGNTVIDALQYGVQQLQQGYSSADVKRVQQILDPTRKLILVTGHRRENFGAGFEQVCAALANISQRNDVQVIYPVHLNPNVQEPVNRLLANAPNINLIAPVDYPAFIYLMKHSYLILTDSGGIQEEAPSLGKPVLVFRDTTERPEAVDAGTVKIVGTSAQTIFSEMERLLDDKTAYQQMAEAINPYGDGFASHRIVKAFGL